MHTPVLLKEVMEAFSPKVGGIYIDATVNGGGHTKEILKSIGSSGRVLGIDRDASIIKKLEEETGKQEKRLVLQCENFSNIQAVANEKGFLEADGVLFDLGFSSYHIESSGRGFSFLRNEPLDMRFNPDEGGIRAADILNEWSEEEIKQILREYGEERFAGSIAAAICETRTQSAFKDTDGLVSVIERAVPGWYRNGRLHPATKTFQALRIRVNDEFAHIEKGIKGACNIIKIGGRIAVITFHSIEDRVVKKLFLALEKEGLGKRVNKKVIKPVYTEIRQNPRSRSAKLRIFERIV